MVAIKFDVPAGTHGRLTLNSDGRGSVRIYGDAAIPIDLSKIHPKAWIYVVAYGIGRGLTDGNAPEKSDDKAKMTQEAVALSEATLEAWYEGNAQARSGARVSEELKAARLYMVSRLVKAGVKPGKVPAMPTLESVMALAAKVGVKPAAVTDAIARHMAALADDADLTIGDLL